MREHRSRRQCLQPSVHEHTPTCHAATPPLPLDSHQPHRQPAPPCGSILSMAVQKQSIRRSTRVLQLCSGALLVLGIILVAMPNDITRMFAGGFSLTAAASGLIGLYVIWHRGLVLFTVMTWTLSLMSGILIMQCVHARSQPPAKAHFVDCVRAALHTQCPLRGGPHCTGLCSITTAILSHGRFGFSWVWPHCQPLYSPPPCTSCAFGEDHVRKSTTASSEHL